MRVAIFTDNDFDKINQVTTTLKAVLRFANGALEPRIYTAADVAVDTSSYYAIGSAGVGLPWYWEMRIHWPRLLTFARELRRQRVSVVHVTTPGPVGLAARWLARHLRLPLVGSYHTELGDYATMLSGSAWLGAVTERYVRWFYRTCNPLLVPSTATRDLLVSRGYRPGRLRVWGRGVAVEQFNPGRASAALQEAWRGDRRSPVILYAADCRARKGSSSWRRFGKAAWLRAERSLRLRRRRPDASSVSRGSGADARDGAQADDGRVAARLARPSPAKTEKE